MSRSRTATSRPLCRSGTHGRRPLPGPRRRSAQPRDKLPLVAQASHPELISRRWYDKTQGAQNSQKYVVNVFGLSSGDVRVLSPFVGGAFGSGLRPQYQLFLAVIAALVLERSVRVVLTRDQMFTFGYRPDTIQTVALGANPDGVLRAMIHEAVAGTS